MSGDVEAPNELALLIGGLADNKLFLGRRYAEWCTAAPTLESAVAAAAMAQDEIGHARSLYPLLREISGESTETEPETRTRFTNAHFLDTPFESWIDFVAANFIFDSALSVLIESAMQSSSTDLASRARRIVEEETLHQIHGEGWVRRLARSGLKVQEALVTSFSVVVPDSLNWYSVADKSLVDDGTLSMSCDALRFTFAKRTNSVLISVGLPCI
ncbi:MAG: hypothetical protein NVSMB52_04390 [Chloroflexota bacterium]